MLQVVDLTGAALVRLGLNNDISAGDYAISQLWSRAIYELPGGFDGIRYRSRQLNDEYCYALFERSGVTVEPMASPIGPVELSALVTQFNVVLV